MLAVDEREERSGGEDQMDAITTAASRKRQLEENGYGGGCDSIARTEFKRQEVETRHEELPGPRLGSGPVWKLNVTGYDASGQQEACVRRCLKLLEQALSCSELAEVRFLFDDGMSLVHGHWAMLCEMSEMFRHMKEIGMQEGRNNEVRVFGVSRGSFRGFIEWIYMGRAGPHMAQADGREVWLLAERYQVEEIKEWLMAEGLSEKGICAAVQYSVEGDGAGRDCLWKAFQLKASQLVINKIDERGLVGVSASALREVLESHAGADSGSYVRGIARYRLVERWACANGIGEGVDMEDDGRAAIMCLLDVVNLSCLPVAFLRDVVKESGIVCVQAAAAAVLEKREGEEEDKLGECQYRVSRICKASQVENPGALALSREWEGQRLAVIDASDKSVRMFDVESGAYLPSVGSLGWTPGRFEDPHGIAFNTQGDVIISDWGNDFVHVFDRDGVHVRSFGGRGDDDGKFLRPAGVAVDNRGQVFVCDNGNHRIQIFGEDGSFMSKFGQKGVGDGEIYFPRCIAVAANGHILISDEVPCRRRVQVFDQDGSFLKAIYLGSAASTVADLAVGAEGKILVSMHPNHSRKHVLRIFNAHGVEIRLFERVMHSRWPRVAVDGQGRIYIVERAQDGAEGQRTTRIVVLANVDANASAGMSANADANVDANASAGMSANADANVDANASAGMSANANAHVHASEDRSANANENAGANAGASANASADMGV